MTDHNTQYEASKSVGPGVQPESAISDLLTQPICKHCQKPIVRTFCTAFSDRWTHFNNRWYCWEESVRSVAEPYVPPACFMGATNPKPVVPSNDISRLQSLYPLKLQLSISLAPTDWVRRELVRAYLLGVRFATNALDVPADRAYERQTIDAFLGTGEQLDL